MYIDPLVKTALDKIKRGRKTDNTTIGYSDLNKLIDTKMPQQVVMAFKKGLENSKLVDINTKKGTKQMLPLNLSITQDENGNYLIKNPHSDKLSEIKVKPKNTGTIRRYDATFEVENDDLGSGWFLGSLSIDKSPQLDSIGSFVTAQYTPEKDMMRIEFYDEWSNVFKDFLDKNKIKYDIFLPSMHYSSKFNWFDIDNVSKYFNITIKK